MPSTWISTRMPPIPRITKSSLRARAGPPPPWNRSPRRNALVRGGQSTPGLETDKILDYIWSRAGRRLLCSDDVTVRWRLFLATPAGGLGSRVMRWLCCCPPQLRRRQFFGGSFGGLDFGG